MNEPTGKYRLKRVMVIDDSQMDRYVASYYIKKYSFAEEVILKESAKSALEYLQSFANTPENLPHYIFLDIRMPDLDGFGFLEEYGKLPEATRKNCVILMLSSSLNLEDHQRAEKNKFVNRFLEKPLDKEKLEMLADIIFR